MLLPIVETNKEQKIIFFSHMIPICSFWGRYNQLFMIKHEQHTFAILIQVTSSQVLFYRLNYLHQQVCNIYDTYFRTSFISMICFYS